MASSGGLVRCKGSIGRYVELQAGGITELGKPMLATGGTTTTRSWTDTNGNFSPDCELTNPAFNGECGPNTNTNFGRAIVTTRYPPGLTEGWGTARLTGKSRLASSTSC